MLWFFRVNGLLLFKDLEIELNRGLTVFTGETGAGKTLILDALSLLMGDRSRTDLIDPSADFMEIQGSFDCPESMKAVLEENDLDLSQELIMTRRLEREGRSKTLANNKLVSLPFVQKIGETLVDFHGQHEHQALLKRRHHRFYLDAFAGNEVQKLKKDYAKKRNELIALDKEAARMQGRNVEEERVRLASEIEVLRKLSLEKNSEMYLIAEKTRLKNGALFLQEYMELHDSIEREGGLADCLESVAGNLQRLASLGDEASEEYARQIRSFSDTVRDVKDMANKQRMDGGDGDADIDSLEERIFELQQQKRRYGTDEDGLKEILTNKEDELEGLDDIEAEVHRIREKRDRLYDELRDKAKELNRLRTQAAERLDIEIASEFAGLNLAGAAFHARVDEAGTEELPSDPHQVSFWFSANPGLPLSPLENAASGGEISRLMLALKNVLASVDMVDTLIFDEIDTGIGGKTAVMIGKKMKALSQKRQVLCITHLPQIAAFADHHFAIEKVSSDKVAYTRVRLLSEKEKIGELARMIGGDEQAEISREQAKHMRELAL